MIFRIFNYLSFRIFFRAFFTNEKKIKKTAESQIKTITKKNFFSFVGMGRTGLVLILRYLKKKDKKKNEIIVQAYNLPGFLEIIEIEKFKIIFTDININNGVFSINEIEKKINSKTAAVIVTNMFNNFSQLLLLKKKLSKKKILLIEDNSIYFDNFNMDKLKKYSGQIGDYVILSFNIMKNISAFYGGAVVHNSNEFKNFCNLELKKFEKFSIILLIKQICIYFVLKLMALNILYKFLFFRVIYFSDSFNIIFLKNIFYPSLRFIKKKQKKFLYQNISFFSKKIIYLQLLNKVDRKKNFLNRKLNNIYLDKQLQKNIHKLKKIKLLPINDYNFQNYLDFPLLVDDKNKFVNFMFKNGIEVRKFHYFNCEKFFSRKKNCKNSEYFEQKLICIPSHPNITKDYLNYILIKIKEYNN